MRALSLLLALAIATGSSDLAFAHALRGGVLANGATPAGGVVGSGRVVRGTVGQLMIGDSSGPMITMCHGYWCFGGSRVVSVPDPPGGPDLPAELWFGLPTPTPAFRDVRFALALPRPAHVLLAIHDAQGRLVQASAGPLEAGRHVVRWDGSDRTGRRTGAGVYFARLAIDGQPFATRRVVIVR